MTMIEVAETRIERPELTGRLTHSLDRGSVILVADAGFGKTTALEQALAQRGGPTVWLRTARADRDPGRLVASAAGSGLSDRPGPDNARWM
jgi:ATP/maltotriose-dependent transcriptional regulator MalT